MSTPINSNEENNTTEDTNDKKATVTTENLPKPIPYEAALLKAFDKLTSQILIFLLAYVILLIGIGVLAVEISDTFKNLLYIIPILGVGAYLWSQRRGIEEDAEKQGIDIKTGIVSGGAEVIGREMPEGSTPSSQKIDVSAGIVSDKAKVIGERTGKADTEDSPESDVTYLINIFKELNKSNRRDVIAYASNSLEKQEKSDGGNS